MKIIFTCLSLLVFIGIGQAQQPAQYSLYMLNKYGFNPAFAGMENSLSITGVYRNQWVGLPGNPETQQVNAHMPLQIASGGIGIGLENETIGNWTQTATTLTYDYQMLMGSSGVLSLGLSAGIVQRKFDGSKARLPEGIYDEENNLILHEDQILTNGIETGSAPTFHFGAFYQSEKLEVGISAINLMENELKMSELRFVQDRTYYLFLGYRHDLNNTISLHPSLLMKSNAEQMQLDFSLIARYNENIFLGATFRGYHSESVDAVALMAGMKLSEKITFGYSYDLGLSNLNSVHNGSHEIMLNYNLGKEIGKGIPPNIIYNPRSL